MIKCRAEEEAKQRTEAWQISSEHAVSHLKNLASRRTDIFGSGDVETEIGQKVVNKK